jgi:hypothetical protein
MRGEQPLFSSLSRNRIIEFQRRLIYYARSNGTQKAIDQISEFLNGGFLPIGTGGAKNLSTAAKLMLLLPIEPCVNIYAL